MCRCLHASCRRSTLWCFAWTVCVRACAVGRAPAILRDRGRGWRYCYHRVARVDTGVCSHAFVCVRALSGRVVRVRCLHCFPPSQNILDDMERAVDDGVNCVKVRAQLAGRWRFECARGATSVARAGVVQGWALPARRWRVGDGARGGAAGACAATCVYVLCECVCACAATCVYVLCVCVGGGGGGGGGHRGDPRASAQKLGDETVGLDQYAIKKVGARGGPALVRCHAAGRSLLRRSSSCRARWRKMRVRGVPRAGTALCADRHARACREARIRGRVSLADRARGGR